jgi:2'-5' RNA ligase
LTSTLSAPLIVTALLGDKDFAFFDGLRRQHYPPELNQVRAHITMFHHLPPSAERELCRFIKHIAKEPAPKARITGLINLGPGVAYRIESDDLHSIRNEIVDSLWDCLIPQDKAPWRPHITVQNKIKPVEAKALLNDLSQDFRPFSLTIKGLGLWRYLGGPWESVAAWHFGTGHRVVAPK